MIKKAVMIIPHRDFRDQEYFVPLEILRSRGIGVETASTDLGIALGADGGDAMVDLGLKDIDAKKFEALIFVGGPGCLKYLDNQDTYGLIRFAFAAKKVIAAICISPVILAKSGILKGKKATVWSDDLSKGPIRVLKENGAIFTDKTVVADGNVITANGPDAAERFGEAVAEKILS